MDSSPQPLETETASDAFASLFAICISFLVLNTLFVFARFFTVLVLRRSKEGLWWDDYFIIPSYLCNLGMIIVGLKTRSVFLSLPLTAHEPINPMENRWEYPAMQEVLKLIYALTNLLMPVLFTTRVSIMTLYLRIFSGRKVRLAIYIVSVLVVLQWISCQLVALLICQPVHKWWDPIMRTGKCVDAEEFYRSVSYPTLVLDAFLIILPIPTVWQLRATKLRKLALSLLFLTSVIALIGSAYRTYIVQTHNTAMLSPSSTNILMVWLIAETSMYLIVACLPALAPLFALCIPGRLRAVGNRAFHLSSSNHPYSPRSDFTRLVDSDATAQAVAQSDGKGIELHERAMTPAGTHVRAGEIEAGNGVLVHTEIIVTQEEKISAVIGI